MILTDQGSTDKKHFAWYESAVVCSMWLMKENHYTQIWLMKGSLNIHNNVTYPYSM